MIGPKRRERGASEGGQGPKGPKPFEDAVSTPLEAKPGKGKGRKAKTPGEGTDRMTKRVLGAAGAIVAVCVVAAGAIAMGTPSGPSAPEGSSTTIQESQDSGTQDGQQAQGNGSSPSAGEEGQGAGTAQGLTQMPNGDMAASYTSKVNADGSITYTYTDENGNKGVCTDLNGSGKADAGSGSSDAEKKAGKTGKEDTAGSAEREAVSEEELASLEQESCPHEYKPVYKTVKVKAEYKSIPHAAVTKEVPTSSTETVCNTCKAVITGHVSAHMAATGHTGYTKGVEVKGTKTVTVKKAWTEKVLVKKATTKKVKTGKEKCSICGKVKKIKK